MNGFRVFEGICTGHYVNCIDEELCRDAGFLLVLAKSEQSEARHDYHGRIGITQLWGVGRRPFVIILPIIGPIFHDLFLNAHLQDMEVLVGRIPPKKERAYPGSQKVVWTTRPQSTEFSRPLRASKGHSDFVIRIVSDDAAV